MNEWEWHLLEDKNFPEAVTIGGTEVKPGDRVRLRPRAGATYSISRWQEKSPRWNPSSKTTKASLIFRWWWMTIPDATSG